LLVEQETLAIIGELDKFFIERQVYACLVGGFVRDFLLGRSTADIDVAVAADSLVLATELADTLGGRFVPLDEVNRIARVILTGEDKLQNKKQWYVDLSSIEETLEQDLARRDFTINAMAVEIHAFVLKHESAEVIDFFNGLHDLRDRRIEVVSESVFKADPARLLRAVRLAAELNFTISKHTEDLIKRDHNLISGVAGERVREELLRVLAVRNAGYYVHYLDRLGILTSIFPELEASRGFEQPREHHWDVLSHSLETVKAVDFLLRQDSLEYGSAEILAAVPWSEKLNQHFTADMGNGVNRLALLRLAALLHDIAKPDTQVITGERMRFFGHTEQGAEKVVNILERLKFSNKEIKLVETIVRYHLRPTQMGNQGLPTRRAIYRYFRDTGVAGIDILFLSLADHLAARGPELDINEWRRHTELVDYVLTECLKKETIVAPPKLVDGHDLINIFGLKPGPRIGEILEAVREAQAAGEISSREEALSYIQNRLLY